MQFDILEARQFLADFFCGEYHIPTPIKRWGEGFCVNMPGELATTDFNDMTRLVLMDHDRGIRVSVRPLNFRYMKLMIHKRDPTETEMSLTHPTIEKAIMNHKEYIGKGRFPIRPNDLYYLDKKLLNELENKGPVTF